MPCRAMQKLITSEGCRLLCGWEPPVALNAVADIAAFELAAYDALPPLAQALPAGGPTEGAKLLAETGWL